MKVRVVELTPTPEWGSHPTVHEENAMSEAEVNVTVNEPLKSRYVVFDRARGVWLGDGFWSYGDNGGRDTAPTYATKTDARRAMEGFIRDPNCLEYRELPPGSGVNGTASMELLTTVFLPRWTPAKKEEEQHEG